MTKTKLHQLAELGQSAWLDYIQRSLIVSGGLRAYMDQGLRGVTSNPSLFEKAIADSNDYDAQMVALGRAGKSPEKIYEELTLEDSRMATDVLRPLYDESHGGDGFFSLEVEPHLAHDTDGSIVAARSLFKRVGRPNLMIKIPATPEGLPAIRKLTAEGININITLMFSLLQYDQVVEAYLSGLEERAAHSESLEQVHSVASIFVSRVDTKVDQMLDALGTPEAKALRGKIAIANAKLAYQHFKQVFHGGRWKALASKGARLQRVLYGSTSTKDPAYSDVMYVENLIGPDTVNTIPPETLEAFLDHGKVALTLEKDLDEARVQLDKLAQLGISLDDATQQVLDEGVAKFVKPYDSLMKTIASKKESLIAA